MTYWPFFFSVLEHASQRPGLVRAGNKPAVDCDESGSAGLQQCANLEACFA